MDSVSYMPQKTPKDKIELERRIRELENDIRMISADNALNIRKSQMIKDACLKIIRDTVLPADESGKIPYSIEIIYRRGFLDAKEKIETAVEKIT